MDGWMDGWMDVKTLWNADFNAILPIAEKKEGQLVCKNLLWRPQQFLAWCAVILENQTC